MTTKPEPTAEELRIAQERMQRLENLSPDCAWDKLLWECTAKERRTRERWKKIMRQLSAFEARYF